MTEAKNYIDNLARCNYINGVIPVSTTSTIDVVADGLTLIPGAGSYLVKFNSQYKILSGNVTAQAALDLVATYNTLMSVPVTNALHVPAFGLGETLSPGVYTISAAGSLSGNLNLDAAGNPNAVFIFRFGGAFNTAAGSLITLLNGALAKNVFFVSEGAIGVGATNTLKGLFLSNGGAVSLGAGCNIEGRLFSKIGAIGISGSVVSIPSTTTYIDLGVLATFALFSSLSNVTNSGVSTITGDIGTNFGSVTGFGTAIVNGIVYLPGVDNNALATFSIYKNGVLVPSSVRVRTLNINTIDISLEVVVDVLAGQSIDVRYKVDAGSVILTNRILTIKTIL